MKDRWSEVEYVVVHQVTDDVPMYEVRDHSRSIKVIYHNRLFLVAPAKENDMPVGGSESISDEGALAELTPLEWESEMPEREVDEVLTQCHTSHVPLGWADGILWPLPSVAL